MELSASPLPAHSLAPLATDAADFAFMRQRGQVYVDKTLYIQRMLAYPMRFVFLARPRRFGKSLLVSTLKCLFTRESDNLFQGLDIHASGFLAQVPRCPVFTLTMAGVGGDDPRELATQLRHAVQLQCLRQGIVPPSADYSPQYALSQVFSDLRQQGRLVILVDEYDAPITRMLGNAAIARENQTAQMHILRDFYGTLKNWSEDIEFVFLTGITRVEGAGLFSALNNVTDISTHRAYATICGFTEEENQKFLGAHIACAARNYGCAPQDMRLLLQERYNGYRFAPASDPVYNPISYLKVLVEFMDPEISHVVSEQGFPRPWIDTGQSSFLFRYMKEHEQGLGDIGESTEGIWKAFDLQQPNLKALLFQAGYLSLKTQNDTYKVGFPNWEVESAFQEGLLLEYLGKESGRGSRMRALMQDMASALVQGNCQQACACFDLMLDKVSYDLLGRESNYQIALHTVCAMIRGTLGVESEVHVRHGRADTVVETRDAFYVFELKLNATVEMALRQIRAKGYGDRYAGEGKRVVGIGLTFREPPNESHQREASAQNWAMETTLLYEP